MATKQTKTTSKTKYTEGIGRRKTAVARVRIMKGKGNVSVNDRGLKEYFPIERARQTVMAPLEKLKLSDKFDVSVHVSGSGLAAQSGAIRHGLARALAITNPEFKKKLRNFGFLTRDPRMVERKKYGLKKARRAPQWAKR